MLLLLLLQAVSSALPSLDVLLLVGRLGAAALVATLAFYPGDQWVVYGAAVALDGGPVNLTGSLIEWKLEDATGAVVFYFTSNDSVVIVNPDNGLFTIAISSSLTAAIVPGTYTHQCRVTQSGVPHTIWTGSIQVKKSFFV